MRPELVTKWRERLPAPFNKPSAVRKRAASLCDCDRKTPARDLPFPWRGEQNRSRRNSATGAVEGSDRCINWLRYMRNGAQENRQSKVDACIEKLRDIIPEDEPICSSLPLTESQGRTPGKVMDENSSIDSSLQHPTAEEIAALVSECFPTVESTPVVITEFSETFLHSSHYTLEEVLVSKCLLNPPLFPTTVRWVFVEYYKIGTFWGSDERCFQWGTDPALFEKSPVIMLQDCMADLDKAAGRAPLEGEKLEGYKRIGKYYREDPGCPEFLGLRVSPANWLGDEKYQLLLKYFRRHPAALPAMTSRKDNDLMYGLQYLKGREDLRESTCSSKDGYREIVQKLRDDGENLLGGWDDHVERLEFYRPGEHVAPIIVNKAKAVANRLKLKDDPLRKFSDTALLYYTLARVSIENDEMMQDGPERALNKLFASMKLKHGTDNTHVKMIFSLQQAVLDGLEYLEENKRELPIWGIPPFPNHRVQFHPEHTPTKRLQKAITEEMDLVDDGFQTIIGHWRSLKDKVARHLDIMIQFRVLEQQELAVKQRDLAVEQQNLATIEAKNSRLQSRSIFLFTAITIIFLPLSFFTSYFGMNFTDIRDTKHSSRFFWRISGPISACIILGIFITARCIQLRKDDDIEEVTSSNAAGDGDDIEAARHTEEEQKFWRKARAKERRFWMIIWKRLWKLKLS
ncbi:hypothetical protein AJ80_03811 [Polytolypa hystricis UAMH7299]|uniref:Uncharacterized protein n=1 Tax=Polytolypa hystricis (strain UAMH7299) TaxID=1447883 RepID=A0A2B7YDP5_POLH7|nr:hypothetical protein AJ80_03811 [Polytolypa hystricis UAMH7299]